MLYVKTETNNPKKAMGKPVSEDVLLGILKNDGWLIEKGNNQDYSEFGYAPVAYVPIEDKFGYDVVLKTPAWSDEKCAFVRQYEYVLSDFAEILTEANIILDAYAEMPLDCYVMGGMCKVSQQDIMQLLLTESVLKTMAIDDTLDLCVFGNIIHADRGMVQNAIREIQMASTYRICGQNSIRSLLGCSETTKDIINAMGEVPKIVDEYYDTKYS